MSGNISINLPTFEKFQLVKTEPFETESVKTEPFEAESVKTESVTPEQFETESVKTEPFEAESVKTESVTPEQFETESVKTEPFEAESVTPEQFETESVKTEPFEAESVTPEQFETKSVTSEPVTTEPVEMEPFETPPDTEYVELEDHQYLHHKRENPGTSSQTHKRRRKEDVSCRDFNPEWEKQFLFVKGKNTKPICLICGASIAVKKKFNLERHHKLNHGGFERKYPLGSSAREKYINMKKLFIDSKSSSARKAIKRSLITSYEISYLFAENAKPYADAKFLKDCFSIFAQNYDATQVNELALSSDEMRKKVREMSHDVSSQKKTSLLKCEYFSLAINETLDLNNTTWLTIFVRTVDSSFNVGEELISLESLNVSKTGLDICNKLRNFFGDNEQTFELSKLESICTCVNSTMTDSNNGCLVLLERHLNREIKKFPCIISVEYLLWNVLNFGHVLDPLVRCIEKIRARTLNGNLCKALFTKDGKGTKEVVLHNTRSWLLQNDSLNKLWRCRQQILEFLKETGELPEVGELLVQEEWLLDFAFLIGLISKLEGLATRLNQTKNLYPLLVSLISSFTYDLLFLELHFKKREIISCHHLALLQRSGYNVNYTKYEEILSVLKDFFKKMSENFERDRDCVSLFSNPFAISDDDVVKYDPNLQLEIVELKRSWALQNKYKKLYQTYVSRPQPEIIGIEAFWKSVPREEFPELVKLALKIMSRFGSIGLCNQAKTSLDLVQNRSQSTMSEIYLKDVVLLSTTKLRPRLKEILKNKQRNFNIRR